MQRSVSIAIVSLVSASLLTYADAESDSAACPAVYNDSSTLDSQVHLDRAQQMAILSRRLEETEYLLHLSHSHPPNQGTRWPTFLLGMLVSLLFVGIAAFLYWEYIQTQLRRKQQVAVVGGLKDMDDSTLKKVLGQVSLLQDKTVGLQLS